MEREQEQKIGNVKIISGVDNRKCFADNDLILNLLVNKPPGIELMLEE